MMRDSHRLKILGGKSRALAGFWREGFLFAAVVDGDGALAVFSSGDGGFGELAAVPGDVDGVVATALEAVNAAGAPLRWQGREEFDFLIVAV